MDISEDYLFFQAEDGIRDLVRSRGLGDGYERQRFDLPLKPLAQFDGNVTVQEQSGILFSLKDYLQLVDTTGRMIRTDKRGAIIINLPPILERLTINRQQWLQQSQ